MANTYGKTATELTVSGAGAACGCCSSVIWVSSTGGSSVSSTCGGGNSWSLSPDSLLDLLSPVTGICC